MSDEPIIFVGPQTARKLATRRRRWPWIVAACAGVAVTVATAVLLWPAPSGPTVPVRRGDIVHSFVANGRIETDVTLDVVPRVSARIAQIHVKEGDAVETGQILVTLDDAPLRSARDAAKARRDEILRGARPEDLDRSQAQVAEAEHALKLAEAKKAELDRGARPEDREEAEARFEIARAEARQAESEWNRRKDLADVSDSEKDQYRRAHETAQGRLREAQARRDRIVNGATKEEKDQSAANVDAAKSRVDQAKAAWTRLKNGATKEEKRAAESELARLEAELSELVLKSPVKGIVLRRYREPNEMAFPQMPQPILVIAESAARLVRVEVSESDLFKVRLGQPATFTADGYPGRRWWGKVTRVSPVLGRKALSTENPKEKSDVKVLEVWITPDDPVDLPINLPVEAHVRETLRTNVLILPSRAVDRDGRVTLAGGEARTVSLGARDDAFVEILSGLSEGEKVRLP